MYHRREARIGFVVPSGDAAELLDLAEEVLDQMASLVHLEVAGDCGDSVGFWRDHRQRAIQFGAQGVAILSASRAATPTLSCRCPGRRLNRRDCPTHRPERRSWLSSRRATWPECDTKGIED